MRVHLYWRGIAALALALSGVAPSWAQNRQEHAAPHSVPRPPRAQQGHAGQWLRQHNNLPPEQQRKALQNDPQFRNLPPQQKQHLENQLVGLTVCRPSSGSKCCGVWTRSAT